MLAAGDKLFAIKVSKRSLQLLCLTPVKHTDALKLLALSVETLDCIAYFVLVHILMTSSIMDM